MKMFLLNISLVTTLGLVALHPAFASKDRGGGDKCQDRIEEVRNDISSWIEAGGSGGLDFSNTGSNLSDYKTKMEAFIDLTRKNQNSISCTDDPEQVKVDGVYKTCVASISAENPQILCYWGLLQDGEVTGGFMGLSQEDQYFQVHHEFAVLSGIEDQFNQRSDYLLSDQISGYLENTVIKKLAIHPGQSTQPIDYLQSCEVVDPNDDGSAPSDANAVNACLSGESQAAKNAALCVRQKIQVICLELGIKGCQESNIPVSFSTRYWGNLKCTAVAVVPSL